MRLMKEKLVELKKKLQAISTPIVPQVVPAQPEQPTQQTSIPAGSGFTPEEKEVSRVAYEAEKQEQADIDEVKRTIQRLDEEAAARSAEVALEAPIPEGEEVQL